MRKPAKAKIAAAFKLIDKSFVAIGAKKVEQTGDDYEDRFWTLETTGGLLKLCASGYDFIHCRFEDVEKAKTVLPSGYSFRLNPFSGKWNFHFYLENIEQALQQFEWEVRQITKGDAA